MMSILTSLVLFTVLMAVIPAIWVGFLLFVSLFVKKD